MLFFIYLFIFYELKTRLGVIVNTVTEHMCSNVRLCFFVLLIRLGVIIVTVVFILTLSVFFYVANKVRSRVATNIVNMLMVLTWITYSVLQMNSRPNPNPPPTLHLALKMESYRKIVSSYSIFTLT